MSLYRFFIRAATLTSPASRYAITAQPAIGQFYKTMLIASPTSRKGAAIIVPTAWSVDPRMLSWSSSRSLVVVVVVVVCCTGSPLSVVVVW
jgi:hypothetical protein